MQRTVYLETSVISYYTSRESRDVVVLSRQRATKRFWALLGDELTPYVSRAVIDEIRLGDPVAAQRRLEAVKDFSVLATTFDLERLAERIIGRRGVPREYPEDALHIAVAAMGGMDSIVTWNFAHINNAYTRMMVRQAVENEGYVCPEIMTPESFLGEEE